MGVLEPLAWDRSLSRIRQPPPRPRPSSRPSLRSGGSSLAAGTAQKLCRSSLPQPGPRLAEHVWRQRGPRPSHPVWLRASSLHLGPRASRWDSCAGGSLACAPSQSLEGDQRRADPLVGTWRTHCSWRPATETAWMFPAGSPLGQPGPLKHAWTTCRGGVDRPPRVSGMCSV